MSYLDGYWMGVPALKGKAFHASRSLTKLEQQLAYLLGGFENPFDEQVGPFAIPLTFCIGLIE